MHECSYHPKRQWLVQAVWNQGEWNEIEHEFSGFSWSYKGEGPHGFHTFLEMLGLPKDHGIDAFKMGQYSSGSIFFLGPNVKIKVFEMIEKDSLMIPKLTERILPRIF